MFVYIRSAASVIVVTQKLVLQQSKNVTAKCRETLSPPLSIQYLLGFFQRCTHLVYCSVLSLGGKVYRRRMSQPDMGSIFHIKKQWNIIVIGNYYVNYQNYQNSMLFSSSDTRRTLIHLFLFTNSAQRELVSICTQSMRDRN